MTNTKPKLMLTGMSSQELKEMVLGFDEPAFRAEQLHHWLYIKSSQSFDQMTNVSKSLKTKLSDNTVISFTEVAERLISKDGTIKYLLRFPDNNCVETVLMRFDNRPNLTACVSSQSGCPVGCVFCATGKAGFNRNLSHAELVDQVLVIQRDTGLKVSNIVFMGQGEPLMNYDNLARAIVILNKSMEISSRRITVSTAGVIPNILRLAKDFPQITLAVSLHAAQSDLRSTLVPLQKKYPLTELIETLKKYYELTHRRVTIEYVLIRNVNDNLNQAKDLNRLLADLHCNINLIPYNPVDLNSKYTAPTDEQVKMFKYILELSGKKVTVRLKRGIDILAACGQLAGKCKV